MSDNLFEKLLINKLLWNDSSRSNTKINSSLEVSNESWNSAAERFEETKRGEKNVEVLSNSSEIECGRRGGWRGRLSVTRRSYNYANDRSQQSDKFKAYKILGLALDCMCRVASIGLALSLLPLASCVCSTSHGFTYSTQHSSPTNTILQLWLLCGHPRKPRWGSGWFLPGW